MKSALLILFAALATATAQVKISELPSATALTGSELTIAVQGGTTKQATITQVGAFTLTNTGTVTNKSISGSANTFSNIPWGTIVSTPTSLSGYGITDAITSASASATFALISHNQAWSTITNTPTTLNGYGITDAITSATAASTYATIAHNQAWGTITGTPTTLAGYGISDALAAADAASTYAPISAPNFIDNVYVSGSVNASRLVAPQIEFEHTSAGGGTSSKIILDTDSGTERDAQTWTIRHNISGTIALLSDFSALNGSNITSGTVPAARLGSGASISTKYLRGDNTWQTISGGGDALTSSSLDQFADVTQAATKTLAITESTTLNGGTHSGTNTGDQTTITGNAGTATALQTGRAINGVTFDGTAAITVTAAAGTLTGTTLASGVTGSSLTSLGTIATGVWQGTAIADTYISSAATWTAKLATNGNGSSLTGITQSQITGLTTTDRPSFANVKIGHSTLTYGATTNIDLDADGFQTLTLTGNVTFTTSNRAAGRSRTVRIIGDTSLRTFTFPAGWTFVGAAAPASIAANKDAVLTITAFGTADTDVVAAFAVEP